MEEELKEKQGEALAAVKGCVREEELGSLLWRVIELYAGCQFYTSKRLPFLYTVKGRELFCDRKEKSITASSILRAYRKVCSAWQEGEPVKGPKQLGMFGAPYIWSILNGTGLMEAAETAGQEKAPHRPLPEAEEGREIPETGGQTAQRKAGPQPLRRGGSLLLRKRLPEAESCDKRPPFGTAGG